MTQGNETTIKWIGIIIGVIVAIAGWFFAGIQTSAAQRAELVEAQVKSNTVLLHDVQIKQVVVMEQLIEIRKDIREISKDLNKHDIK